MRPADGAMTICERLLVFSPASTAETVHWRNERSARLAGPAAREVAGHLPHPAHVDPDHRQDPDGPRRAPESLVARSSLRQLARADHRAGAIPARHFRDRVRFSTARTT